MSFFNSKKQKKKIRFTKPSWQHFSSHRSKYPTQVNTPLHVKVFKHCKYKITSHKKIIDGTVGIKSTHKKFLSHNIS